MTTGYGEESALAIPIRIEIIDRLRYYEEDS
jgi:hypothetical protein